VPEAIEAAEARARDLEGRGPSREALAVRRDAISLALAADRPRLAAVLFVRMGQGREGANDTQAAVLAYEGALRALTRDPSLRAGEVVDRLARDPDAGGKGPIPSARPGPSDLYAPLYPGELAAAEAEATLLVKVLVSIGNAYARMPQDAVALGRYREALARPEAAKDPDLRAGVLASAAEMERRLGRTDRARADLAEAWATLPSQASRLGHRRLLLVRGALERDGGLLPAAEATYRDAAELCAAARDTRCEGAASTARAEVLLRLGRLEEARDASGLALERARASDDEELTWQAARGLGEALRRLGDLDGAVRALRAAVERADALRGRLATDEGKVALAELSSTAHDALVSTLLDRGRPRRGRCAGPATCSEVLEAVERARGRALEDLMACSGRGLRGEPAGPLTCEGLVRSLGGVEMATAVPCPLVPEGVFYPNAQMAVGIASAPRALRPAAAPAPAGAAPRPLARLAFHVLADRTAVLVAAADGSVRGHVAPIGKAALAERVGDLRAALQVNDGARRGAALLSAGGNGGGAGPLRVLLAGLYRDLVEPVEAFLPPAGALLAVEPHDALWLVPFAALRRPNGELLGDRWPLLFSPSAEVLDEVRRRPRGAAGDRAKLSVLAVGNPLRQRLGMAARGHSFSFAPLPAAEGEARAVRALFRGQRSRLLLPGAADLDAVLRDIERQDVLHFATHGVALPDHPLDSFLVLTPSPRCRDTLTARQVTLLSLRADLVVLSACQTGLGRATADGMIGLARAFLAAGARTVVMSQWSVSDVATAALMEAFYRAYVGGADKATALQRAMREVRAAFPDERHWAPFVVFGAED